MKTSGYNKENTRMKYYIVLDPILYTDPYCIFAQPQTFDKTSILTAFHKQSIAKLFTYEDQAFHYARSLSKNPKGHNSNGFVAPIIECELNLLNAGEQKKEFCRALDGDPDITKTNLICKSITYIEVPIKDVHDEALKKVFFPKESMPTIDLRNHLWTCAIL